MFIVSMEKNKFETFSRISSSHRYIYLFYLSICTCISVCMSITDSLTDRNVYIQGVDNNFGVKSLIGKKCFLSCHTLLFYVFRNWIWLNCAWKGRISLYICVVSFFFSWECYGEGEIIVCLLKMLLIHPINCNAFR